MSDNNNLKTTLSIIALANTVESIRDELDNLDAGTSSFVDLDVTGDVTVGGNASITGNVTIDGELTVATYNSINETTLEFSDPIIEAGVGSNTPQFYGITDKDNNGDTNLDSNNLHESGFGAFSESDGQNRVFTFYSTFEGAEDTNNVIGDAEFTEVRANIVKNDGTADILVIENKQGNDAESIKINSIAGGVTITGTTGINIGATGVNTTFDGPIIAIEGVTGDVTGDVKNSAGNVVLNAGDGTTNDPATFTGDVSGSAETVTAASQSAITTLESLTGAGTAGVNTTFAGPIVASQGVTGGVTGDVTGDVKNSAGNVVLNAGDGTTNDPATFSGNAATSSALASLASGIPDLDTNDTNGVDNSVIIGVVNEILAALRGKVIES